MSGTGIDHDYDTANSNNINTTPYEPRRGAEDSAGAVTDAVKSYSQSQAETFKIGFLRVFRRLADNTMRLWRFHDAPTMATNPHVRSLG